VEDDDTAETRSRMFTLRMWSEPVKDGTERRGCVRDVASGAFRNFRDWSALTSFLTEQLDETPRGTET
jgi:hypothetical protein